MTRKTYVLIKLQQRRNRGAIGYLLGSNWGENIGSVQRFLVMARSNQYCMYLKNQSNMITELFYTGFAHDLNVYTYVYNVLDRCKTDQNVSLQWKFPSDVPILLLWQNTTYCYYYWITSSTSKCDPQLKLVIHTLLLVSYEKFSFLEKQFYNIPLL